MSVWRKINRIFAIGLIVSFGFTAVSSAACSSGLQTCSSDYGVGEVFFGSGGNLNSCSTSYCSKQSLGETGEGNTKSTDYQAQGGFNTDRIPSLTLLVNTTSVNLGTIGTSTTGTGTATFSVKSYLADGYVVQTAGTPLSQGSYTVAGMSSTAASSPGTEQFGINLVANNSCAGVANGNGGTISGSSNPVEVPSSSFSFGAAASGYNTACQFKYVNGDTIASSNSSSGETDYTMSYVFNVKPLTPAGTYTMTQTIIATSTF